jgi:hypothetical protein
MAQTNEMQHAPKPESELAANNSLGKRIDETDINTLVVNLPVHITREQLLSLLSSSAIKETPSDRHYLAVQRAQWILRIMVLRLQTKAGSLHADPGWAVLLDLFVREALGKTTNVSAACIGSLSPPTTGLRWVTLLEKKGIVYREPVKNDERQFHIRLTEPTRDELIELLTTPF